MGVWAEQAAKFTPFLRVGCIVETAARRGTTIASQVQDCDIVVTSYTLARLEADQWSGVALAGVVIDEAQAVKNPRTATYRALRDMDAPLAPGGERHADRKLAWATCGRSCP